MKIDYHEEQWDGWLTDKLPRHTLQLLIRSKSQHLRVFTFILGFLIHLYLQLPEAYSVFTYPSNAYPRQPSYCSYIGVCL